MLKKEKENKKSNSNRKNKPDKTKKRSGFFSGLMGLSGDSDKDEKGKETSKDKDKGGGGLAITPERVIVYGVGGIVLYFGLKEVIKKMNANATEGEVNTASASNQQFTSSTSSSSDAIQVKIPARRVFPICYGIQFRPEVAQAQALLMKAGYSLPRFGADGKFGSETQAAIRRAFAKDCITREDFVALANEAYGKQDDIITIDSKPEMNLAGLGFLDNVDINKTKGTSSDESDMLLLLTSNHSQNQNQNQSYPLSGTEPVKKKSSSCSCGGRKSALGMIEEYGTGKDVFSLHKTIAIEIDEDGERGAEEVKAGSYLGKEIKEHYDPETGLDLTAILTEGGNVIHVPTQDLMY